MQHTAEIPARKSDVVQSPTSPTPFSLDPFKSKRSE
jgi:hypothetical protein